MHRVAVGNVTNPSGFVVKKVMTVTPKVTLMSHGGAEGLLEQTEVTGPSPEELGVDERACQMLRTLPIPNQQEILDLLSQGLADANVSNPSGFVVKKVMSVTPRMRSEPVSMTPLLDPASMLIARGGIPSLRASPY